jgi:hypothetical protein
MNNHIALFGTKTPTVRQSGGSGLMVRRRLHPHFSATVRQSEGSASMVRLLPATEEASRGSAPADTLGGTTRPKSVYSSLWTFWTYGVNDNTLFEAGDGGGERRCPPSWRRHPPDVKKNFRFGPLPGGKPKFKLSRLLLYYRVDSVVFVFDILSRCPFLRKTSDWLGMIPPATTCFNT